MASGKGWHKTKLDYSFEITCERHEQEGMTCFAASAVVRDANGKEVAQVANGRLHSYVEAAEDEAVEAARAEIRSLRAANKTARK